jgi:hypothetical protein
MTAGTLAYDGGARTSRRPLNPLKFCLEAIGAEFEKLDLCECSALLAANERTVVASRTVSGAHNRLEDFFPFDPLDG